MLFIKTLTKSTSRLIILSFHISLVFNCIACQGDHKSQNREAGLSGIKDKAGAIGAPREYLSVNNILVLPKNPRPEESFRILVTGQKDISKAQIVVSGPSGNLRSHKSKTGEEFPFWRIDDFSGSPAGKYKVVLIVDEKEVSNMEFSISEVEKGPPADKVWKTVRGWDSGMEGIYSAWINSLFYGCDEQSSWPALHEVTQNKNQNFLYNYLSLGEDDPDGKSLLVMQPDCADNPFFLRAYFSWKLGLPFGYHICDRGTLERKPRAGQWITNEFSNPKANPVASFNSFLRRMKDGVQSGTARTALDDENSDYYPVPLEQGALLPGTVFADPYGHTLIIIGHIPQTKKKPGLLLSVDAQPDGTVAIKRFWKGNFLFNTSGVIGEPGFKAFRPVTTRKGILQPIKNKELTSEAGFVPYSLQQRKMEASVFYHTMERIINPKPLDPETALLGLIEALHEQLLVRVTSVANGEAYFKSHPGAVVPMPSSAAAIFQSGGQWEDFSTPNRDLRLLIAMDAVVDFPDLVRRTPQDFNFSGQVDPEQVKKELKAILDKKTEELAISYIATDGSIQKLTLSEILKRRDGFEMAYNPNDGIEIRWGAPEKSDERARSHRHAPSNQEEKMRSVRKWFNKRLHPPT
jgi:hypothetical protein